MATSQRTFRQLFASSVVAASITIPVPKTGLAPADGIISPSGASDGSGNSSGVDNNVILAFFGNGTNGQTATARITAWRKVTNLWIPSPLVALALTYGTQVGVAGTEILATQNFVTTITASTAFTTANEIINPGDNSVALVKVDFCGAGFIQVDLAKGTCTDINCLVSTY